jgi:AraC-like DNA-binding protein
MCFGDSFYSFWLKGRMMEAVKDIIFTPLSLKEIAFKNRFLDYQNMYKAFTRHGVVLKTIPRLAKL